MKRHAGLWCTAIVAIFVSAAVALDMPGAIHAGTLPDISGTWYANGDRSKPCSISQSGDSLTLRNEIGQTASGHFNGPSQITAQWGGQSIVGRIGGALQRINWGNGTFWARASGGSSYSSGNYSSTPQYVATPRPTPTPTRLNVTVRVENNDTSPIHIYGASLEDRYSQNEAPKWVQCVWFRNVSSQEAKEIRFHGTVLDHEGVVEREVSFSDTGTFTAPVRIDEHCWHGALWAEREVRRMTREILHVTAVTFAGGTTWKPGLEFVRAYSNGGERLAEPVTQGGGSSGESPSPAPATSAGAMLYGAIFYSPGTYAAGSATDRQTAEAARADALSACNAQANGATNCQLGVEFSSVRCGALGVLNGKVEYGVGADERDARAMVIGKIPGAKILTIACN
jgi:hypothetical protein